MMQPKLIIVVITLALVLVPIVGLSAQTPESGPDFTTSKVIVSQVGEVTQDVRAVGEVIKYKVYFRNNSDQQADIVITDKLDTNLSHVAVFNDGIYDEQNHSVIWKIGDILGGQNVSVEFEAVIGMANLIRNQATIQVDGQRDIQTNTVETTICVSPELGWIPFDGVSKPGEVPRSAMKDETTMGIMVNFDIPGMYVYEVCVDKVVYHRMSIPGYAALMDIGKPELPIVGQIIEVPYDVNFDIEIVKSKSISLECYNVYPAQEPVVEQETEETEFALDKETYLTNAYYPMTLAEVTAEDIGVIRGHRVVFLKVHPVRYNPVTRKIEAYTQIEVRLKYDKPAQIKPVDGRIRSAAFEELLQSSILNYKEPNWFGVTENDDTQADSKYGCDYLIITHDDFVSDPNNAIVQLQDWKQHKGLRTRVVKIGDIGNTAADIQSYLQNAYDHWSPVPTYVLLVGDANFIVPDYQTDHNWHRVNVGTPNERDTQVGTDLYYATLDGDDYFPDIMIGRISADTTADVTTIVDKILDYEKTPPDNADFYNNTSLVRLFEDDQDYFDIFGNPIPDPHCAYGDPDGREDCNWILIELAEEWRDFLLGLNNNYVVHRIYNFSGNFAQGPQQWEDGTNLPVNLTFNGNPPFMWDGDDHDITDAFNDGNFLISYRGHGGRAGWGNPNFHTWDFFSLNNGTLTPVIFGLTCQTGWFDDETDDIDLGTNNDCFAEEILRENNGGAVAIIASARNSWGGTNNEATKGMCDALWPDFDDAISAGYLPRMGQINTYSKVYMARNIGHGDARLLTFEMSHLFGDPEMPVWTEAPADFDVDHPVGIGSTGEQDFIVKVTDVNTGDPVQSAVVVLTRGGMILGTKQTNPGGIVRFTLTTPGNGDLDITVTALNYRPYQGIIEINNGGADLNRLEPEDGIQGQTIHVGGQDFLDDEKVDIYFDNQPMPMETADSTAGKFGQSGVEDVDIQVPTPYNLGPVNILAHGQTSDRYAVDVFQVRTANPIDLYTYSQWDDTTWHLQADGVLTWNNPEIQLYDSNGNSVGSNNLVVGNQYTIRAKVHNDTNFDANDVKVVFKWVNCGLGQPDRVWEDIGTDGLNVPNNSVREAEIEWAPPSTGHLCAKVEIYHIEDINESNNKGQENLHVGPTSSSTEVSFAMWNPTKEPAYVFLELRQLVPEVQEGANPLWGTWITHPVPQLIEPNGMTTGWVIIDPDYADIKEGEAEFVLTGYINGEIIGGVNFIIQKEGGRIDVFGPCWCCVIVIILLLIIVAILFMILRNLRSRKYFPKGENRP